MYLNNCLCSQCVHGMRSAVTSSPLQRVYQKTYAAGPAPKAGEGKMRYVPPPQAAQAAAATTSPPGKGKMKYVPPPTNAGVWNRPEVCTKFVLFLQNFKFPQFCACARYFKKEVLVHAQPFPTWVCWAISRHEEGPNARR